MCWHFLLTLVSLEPFLYTHMLKVEVCNLFLVILYYLEQSSDSTSSLVHEITKKTSSPSPAIYNKKNYYDNKNAQAVFGPSTALITYMFAYSHR